MEKDKTNYWLAAIVVILIVGLAVGFGTRGAFISEPTCDYSLYTLTSTIKEPDYSPYTLTSEIEECAVIEETVTEIEVDDGVLDFIFNNNGNIEYILYDLDDDEVDQIPLRIEFINKIKIDGAEYVKLEFADEMDKEEYTFEDESVVKFDEDDIERVRVQDDSDEIAIDDLDFEDLDAILVYTVKFEQDDIKFEADLEVEFKDGIVDDIELLEIRER